MTALIYRLGHIALNVVDLDAALSDTQAIAGARVVHQDATHAILTSNRRHAEVVLHRAQANEVRAIGLEAVGLEAVEEVGKRAKDRGLRILSETPSLPGVERSVTFASSEGHIFEVHTPVPEDQPLRYVGAGIHPRYLDHVNLSAADPEAIASEFSEVMGLILTERTTGFELMWMRAGDGRHHTVGLKKGQTGLHHFSWELSDFSDFKRLGDKLDACHRNLVWGPGRHGAGDNLFIYYIDSAGFMIECTAEMEVIGDPHRQVRITDAGENLSNAKVVNRWGALPPRLWINHHTDFVGTAR
ncbi:VOC family protein [Ensifer sp. NM-2]|uniref:VOC family protein n=1 Tax=Ensifer sp. NM-2 TaxID=2109730 RepID=UPI001304C0EE|nr:VOC family protein [Ensifer sp. NM-2]